MKTVVAKIPEELHKELENIVQESGRTEEDILHEAIKYYLEEIADILEAQDMLMEISEEILDYDQIRKENNL